MLVVREWNHCKCLAILVTRTNVSTVSTAYTVENADLNAEMHTCHRLRNFHLQCLVFKSFHFFIVENERTDTSMRANVSAFVTLNTVFGSPFRIESLNTTLFKRSRTVLHRTVYHIVLDEVGNFQQVAHLTVDRTNNFLNVCRSIVGCIFFIVCKVRPSWVYW